jgi:hypothetical protein
MKIQAINQLEILVWRRAQIEMLVRIIVPMLSKGVEMEMQAVNQPEAPVRQ